ncbi:MAG: hypothetical protein D8M59_10660 [Planctomycetes bacterium]|nr:hypothetical protein [Planctomycetota bacterium]NOG55302.1 hypothetical protein [Planctomycetota bacterium]
MQKMSGLLSTFADAGHSPCPTGRLRTRSQGLGNALAAPVAALAILMPAIVGIPGCADPSSNYATIDYVVEESGPGTPLVDPGSVINVSNKLGFAVSLNQVNRSLIEYSETVPPTVMRGKQTFTSMNYVKSKALRLATIQQPVGSKIVQVDVGLQGELPLKSMQSSAAAEWNPAPILHDNLGDIYHPIGYIQKTESGKNKTTLSVDPGFPIKDLRQLPVLSRSRPETLQLIFRVNEGVTLTGYSYAGKELRTFNVEVR